MCSTNTAVVAPDYVRGFDRQKGLVIKIVVLMTVIFFAALIPGSYLKPAARFCPEDEPDCQRPDLFAFEFICSICFIWQSFVSVRSWHIRRTPMKTIPDNPVGRVYGYSEESELIAAVSLAFQFWDMVGTPFLPEFCSAIMMGHHILAAAVSFIALQYQYYHYYAVFFLALSEVSSIPLVIMSLTKYYPPTPGSTMAVIAGIAPALFAITFTYYRVILWIKVSRQLWSDAHHVLSTGKAEQYRPGKSYCLYLILMINALLTVLQLYWFALIITKVLEEAGFDVPSLNPGFEE